MKKSLFQLNVGGMYKIFAVIAFLLMTGVSQAATLTFDNITNNSSVQLSDQLSVDYSAFGSDVGFGVEFIFKNAAVIGSSITDVYIDYGVHTNLFTSLIILDSTTPGVLFDLIPNPENLPAGETIGFYSDLGADSTTPHLPANGVNASTESLSLLAVLNPDFEIEFALDQILNGGVRVGMHLQSIAGAGTNDSDSYATNVSPVPVPAAAWLFGTALFGFFAASKRRKNIV